MVVAKAETKRLEVILRGAILVSISWLWSKGWICLRNTLSSDFQNFLLALPNCISLFSVTIRDYQRLDTSSRKEVNELLITEAWDNTVLFLIKAHPDGVTMVGTSTRGTNHAVSQSKEFPLTTSLLEQPRSIFPGTCPTKTTDLSLPLISEKAHLLSMSPHWGLLWFLTLNLRRQTPQSEETIHFPSVCLPSPFNSCFLLSFVLLQDNCWIWPLCHNLLASSPFLL